MDHIYSSQWFLTLFKNGETWLVQIFGTMCIKRYTKDKSF